MSDLAAPIDLAHEPVFAIGPLTVRPSTREIVGDGGRTEVLEPRVMQVLVALHRAGGAILSRDDLTRSCWEGRVVGEDAINRVISRLRRTAQGIGDGAFRVETVTKVGYRLIESAATFDTAFRPDASAPPRSRRALLAAAAGIAAVALAGGGWWAAERRSAGPALPPADIAALMTQAELALAQDTREGQNQAIGLYQQVVATEPRYADGWGALAIAYAFTAHYRPPAESAGLRQRAHAAAVRALAIDPGNGYGQVALATGASRNRAWLRTERTLRRALSDHPDNEPLLMHLALTLGAVGRNREAADVGDRIVRLRSPEPDLVFTRIFQLWGAGRQEEADQLMAKGGQLFPTHFAVWFARFYVLLYTGRASAALAMTADRTTWPSGIPDEEIAKIARVANAALTRAPADIAAVMRENVAMAHRGTGYAENALQFACLFGEMDEAFAIADAYYLARGWSVPDIRFGKGQGTYLGLGDRQTLILFNPVTAPMRVDSRFGDLVRALGLDDYWRRSGSSPDYRGHA